MILDLLVAVSEGAVLFTFVFFLKRLYDLTDLFVTGGTDILSTGQLLFSLLPTILLVTFPMSILLASLLVYGRMADDNELTALQGAGYSTRQLLIPALIVGAVLTCLLLWWGHRIAPKGLRYFKVVASRVLKDTATTGIRPGGFNHLGMFTILPSSIESGKMRSVRMFEIKDKTIASVISASTGTIAYTPANSSIKLNLHSGNLHQIDSQGREISIQFDQFQFSISIPDLLRKLAKTGREEQRISSSQLYDFVHKIYPAYPQAEKERLAKWYYRRYVELIRRQAMPFACLIMAVIGALLGLESRYGKRSTCYSMTIAVIFIYYILLSFGKTYAEVGALPVPLSIWFPNIISLFYIAYLYYRTMRAAR